MVPDGHLDLALLFLLSLPVLHMDPVILFGLEDLLVHERQGIKNSQSNYHEAMFSACFLLCYLINQLIHLVLEVQAAQEVLEEPRKDLRRKQEILSVKKIYGVHLLILLHILG